MTPDVLRPLLFGYRNEVEKAWSADTAHEAYVGGDSSPVGQCGVTSLWLQERLSHDHGVLSSFCVGTVVIDGHVVETNHCWLEIGSGVHRVIADLTPDQMGHLPAVICDTDRALISQDILYLARTEDVESDCADRLALLKAGL